MSGARPPVAWSGLRPSWNAAASSASPSDAATSSGAPSGPRPSSSLASAQGFSSLTPTGPYAAPYPSDPTPSALLAPHAPATHASSESQPDDASVNAAAAAAEAARTEATLSTWKKTLLALTDCTVCLTRIARGESVLLKACNHAVCAKCAAHQRQANTPVVCGICQLASPSAADASDVRHPLVEAELADGLERAACTKCLESPDEDDRLPATVACSDCHWNLCESHATHHRLAPKFKAHALTPLPDSAAAPRCSVHDQPFTAYCTSDACRALACTLCLASTHPVNSAAHSVRVLDDAFVSELRGRLQRAVETARDATEACIRHAVAALGACEDTERRDASLRTEVTATFRLVRAMLEQREQEVLSELETLGKAERAALTLASDKDAHTWCVLTSTADVAERLLGSSATVLAQLEPAAEARLRSLVDAPADVGNTVLSLGPASASGPSASADTPGTAGRPWGSYWSPPPAPGPVAIKNDRPLPAPIAFSASAKVLNAPPFGQPPQAASLFTTSFGPTGAPAGARVPVAASAPAFAPIPFPSPVPGAVPSAAPLPASAFPFARARPAFAVPTRPSVGLAAAPSQSAALDRSAPLPAPLRFDVDADAKVLEAAIARLGRFTQS